MYTRTSTIAAAIASAIGLVASMNVNAYDVRQHPSSCHSEGAGFDSYLSWVNYETTFLTRVVCPFPQSTAMQADQIKVINIVGYDGAVGRGIEGEADYDGAVTARIKATYPSGSGAKWGKYGISGGTGNLPFTGNFTISLAPTGLGVTDRGNFVAIEFWIPPASQGNATAGRSTIRGIFYGT